MYDSTRVSAYLNDLYAFLGGEGDIEHFIALGSDIYDITRTLKSSTHLYTHIHTHTTTRVLKCFLHTRWHLLEWHRSSMLGTIGLPFGFLLKSFQGYPDSKE